MRAELVFGGRHPFEPGLHLEPLSSPVLAHLDEGDEEIQNAVAQLLHIRMLIGRPLVAINGDALVDNIPLDEGTSTGCFRSEEMGSNPDAGTLQRGKY